MIPVHAVVEAVHAAAQEAPGLNGAPVEIHTAPKSPPATYAVIEVPPGADRYGSLGCPHDNATVRVRIRGVARHNDPAAAARVAQRLTGAIAGHLLARSTDLSGPGWEVDTREQIADGGIDPQGDIANHTVDIDVRAVNTGAPIPEP